MLRKTVAALALLLVAALPFGCTRNDPDAPGIGGYSTGLIITKVTAIPDTIPADGVSESRLRLELRHRDGYPLPGRDVVFFVTNIQIGGIPGLDQSITLRFCSGISSIGFVRVATDTTDANGVAWGVYRSGTGPVYGEERDDVDPNIPFDPCDPNDPLSRLHCPTGFWTVVRGEITDPREGIDEYESKDDVLIEQYGGICNPGGTT